MKFENQVISLEIAKRLKELGVKQESLFGYFSVSWGGHELKYIDTIPEDYSYSVMYYAFTVAELGEMLPAMCIEGEKRVSDKWNIDYIYSETEANVRGKMLIYLLENNLINLEVGK